MSPRTDPLELGRRVAEAALGMKARDLVALDVRGLTAFADVFLVATGTSDRHLRAVADAVVQSAKERGTPPLGIEGYEEASWILIDLNEVVVHLFLESARDHYDLERLWSDAPALDVGADEETRQERLSR